MYTKQEIKKANTIELLNEYAMERFVMLKPQVVNNNSVWRLYNNYFSCVKNEILERCGKGGNNNEK